MVASRRSLGGRDHPVMHMFRGSESRGLVMHMFRGSESHRPVMHLCCITRSTGRLADTRGVPIEHA